MKIRNLKVNKLYVFLFCINNIARIKIFAFIFILLSTFSCNKPVDDLLQTAENVFETNPDSTRICIEQINPVKLKGKTQARYALLCAKVQFNFYCYNAAEMDSLTDIALNYYKTKNDSLYIAKMLYWKGQMKRTSENCKEAAKEFEESLKYIPQNDTSNLLSSAKGNLGYLYLFMNKKDKTLNLFKQLVDECKQQDEKWAYNINVARIYVQIDGMRDSSLFYYKKTIDDLYLYDKKEILPSILNELAQVYSKFNMPEKAIETAFEAKKNRITSKNISKHNLLIGELFIKMHKTDSAAYYLNLAANTNDNYISSIAYNLLCNLEKERADPKNAYEYYKKQMLIVNKLESDISYSKSVLEYREKILGLENEHLKMEKQRHELYLLLISLSSIIVLAIGYILFMIQRKKMQKHERRQKEKLLKEEAKRLENENILLKKESELNILRKKDAQLRESLFRRMTLSQKIPSLTQENTNKNETESNKHIILTEEDKDELIRTTNDAYDNFATRLQTSFPVLSRNDVIFCCLLKIKVTMNDLADIYCVGKATITKKKTRLKNEKFNLQDYSFTLDKFLDKF